MMSATIIKMVSTTQFAKKMLVLMVLLPSIILAQHHPDTIFEPEEHLPPLNTHGVEKSSESRFSSGIVSIPIQAGNDSARGINPDGNANFGQEFPPVIVGHSHDGTSYQVALVRLMYDGALDTTFSTSGKFTYDLTGVDDLAHAVIAINTSTYQFAGRGGSNKVNWMLGRIKTTGKLDTTFYTTGVRLGSFFTEAEIFRALRHDSIAGARQVTAAGYAWKTGKYNFVVGAFATDGQLDTTFNTIGYQIVTFTGESGALAITALTGGSSFLSFPLIAGPVYNGSDWDLGFARFTTNGLLDTAFNTTGTQNVPVLSGNDKLYALVTRDSSNAYYAGGYAYNGTQNNFAIVRLRSNGVLDTGFGTTGKITTTFFGGDDVVFALENTTSAAGIEQIYAVGSANNAGNTDIAVARYLSSGSIDTTFHTDGKNTFDAFGAKDVAAGARIGGRTNWLVVGARVTNGGNEDFALLRIETDGTLAVSSAPSHSFGSSADGTVVSNISGNDAAVQLWYLVTTPSLYTFGRSGSHFVTQKFGLGFGPRLDTSFDTDGYYEINLGGTEQLYGIDKETGTTPLLVGDNGSDFLLVQPTSNLKSLDTSFNTTGSKTIDFNGNDRAYSVSNRYVVGKDGSTPTKMAIAHILADGTLDTSFFTNGKRTLAPTANAAVAKYASTTGHLLGDDGQDLVAYRLANDGSLNTAFYTSGLRVYDFGATETMVKGRYDFNPKMLIFLGANASDFLVVRITSSGVLDTGFNTSGSLTIDFGTVGEVARGITGEEGNERASGSITQGTFSTGKLYVAGDDGNNFLLARLFPDGRLDTSFNTTGKRAYPLTGASTCNDVTTTREGVILLVGSTNGNSDWVTLEVHP